MRWIIIGSIIVLVLIGTAVFKIGKIEEKIVEFAKNMDNSRLPLSTGEKEESTIPNLKSLSSNPSQERQAQNLTINLVAVGDIMLSRNVGQKMVQYQNYFYPFAKTAAVLQKADIVLGNLESPLLAGPPVNSPSMIFRADPECAPALARAGFNVLSLANNHIMNQGTKGLERTLELLSANKIVGVGAGRNATQAHQAQIIERKGIKIAFLAYVYPGNPEATENSTGAALMNPEQAKKDIAQARNEADLVVVSMHAGSEYTRYPNETQKNFAHAVIDAGADLVIGHHPHWHQIAEQYKGKYILYSLGNFIFDQMWSEETREGVIASIHLDKKGVQGLEFLPVKIFDYSQPRFVALPERERILGLMEWKAQEYPLFYWQDGEIKEARYQTQRSDQIFANIPSQQKMDLDQDGELEEIIWENGQIKVVKAGAEIWRSDAEWQVVDFAWGDFNQDEARELALALWKKGDYAPGAPLETAENQEHWGSHLFLYSFREGQAKLIWGSSLLERRILEIDAGDLNQDGRDELYVLEAEYGKKIPAASDFLLEMQWEDWGFTKKWEKPGNYYNLRVYNQGDLGYYIYVYEMGNE